MQRSAGPEPWCRHTGSMRSALTLAVAQPRCHPYDVESNAAEHGTIVAETNARLVVFPELSLTGYHFDAGPVGDDDPRLGPLVAVCREHNATALVGAPSESDGHRYIAMLAVNGEGAAVVYRKMFLGAAEEAAFSAGREPGVVSIDGWRIGLAICKDTGSPAQATATAALDIDIYAAGVLESLDDREVQPGRARAIVESHRVWVAIASFAGSTGEGYDLAAGGSTIWAPDGSVAATTGIEPGRWTTTVVTEQP